MQTEHYDGKTITELLQEFPGLSDVQEIPEKWRGQPTFKSPDTGRAATIGEIVQERLSQPAVKSVRIFKVRHNEPCPCGSGKKFKYCCRNV